MNPYLQPQGFLGTGASLLADLTLLAYILLLVPGMITGFVFARQGKYRPNHKYTMITITVINWVLIVFLMLTAYSYDVIGNIASQPGNTRYLIPSIHGVLGLVAQVLATYVIFRMLREEQQVAAAKKRGEPKDKISRFYFTNAKYFMRTVLALWLLTSLLGIFNYLIRYDILPNYQSNQSPPAVTAEPAATDEPSATDEPAATEAAPAMTDEPAVTVEPAMTEEIPAATEESEAGSNSGMGMGGDG